MFSVLSILRASRTALWYLIMAMRNMNEKEDGQTQGGEILKDWGADIHSQS